jgi:hypothetical protein
MSNDDFLFRELFNEAFNIESVWRHVVEWLMNWKGFVRKHSWHNRGRVCPQSPFGVLKNCGAQTNWARARISSGRSPCYQGSPYRGLLRSVKNFQSFPMICRKPHMASSIYLRATIFQNPEGTLGTHCIIKAFAWRDWGNPWNPQWDSRSPTWDLKKNTSHIKV